MYVRALSPTTTTLRRKKEEPQDPYASAQKGPNYHALVRASAACRTLSLSDFVRPSIDPFTPTRTRHLTQSRQIPFMYAPALPLIRISLRGRLPQQKIDIIFGAAVLTALAHAGYIMSSDSSV